MPKKTTDHEPVDDDVTSLNVALLRGRCSSPPEVRILTSGQTIAQLQVTTRTNDQAVSVPVAVWDPPAWVESLDAGDDVLVFGRVRRRFFRTAAGTGSRVEVDAEYVARGRDRRRTAVARRKVDEALAELDG